MLLLRVSYWIRQRVHSEPSSDFEHLTRPRCRRIRAWDTPSLAVGNGDIERASTSEARVCTRPGHKTSPPQRITGACGCILAVGVLKRTSLQGEIGMQQAAQAAWPIWPVAPQYGRHPLAPPPGGQNVTCTLPRRVRCCSRLFLLHSSDAAITVLRLYMAPSGDAMHGRRLQMTITFVTGATGPRCQLGARKGSNSRRNYQI